jgi:cytidylate kinase
MITGAAKVGHVVVVGRGAQVLFANRRDVLHVRIVAPLQLRVAYVMQREGLDLKTARSRVQLKENDRHRYLQAQYRRNPDDSHLYDLVVNTGVLSLDSAVALIAQALQYKTERLATATEDLGPGTGLQPYLSQPGDFRPPKSVQDTAK